MEEKKRENVISISKIIATIFSLAAFVWIIVQITHTHYQAQIENYKLLVENYRNENTDIRAKAEGLFEPALWKVDTIVSFLDTNGIQKFDGSISLAGGKVEFTVYKIDPELNGATLIYKNEISGIIIFAYKFHRVDEPLDRFAKININVAFKKDRYEFSIDKQKYYLMIFRSVKNKDLIIGKVFILNPLYKPIE